MIEKQLITGNTRGGYGRYRLIVLAGAFLLILLNPLLNYYLHFNFVQGWYQSLGVGKLWFVSPLEGLESLLISKQIYLPSLVGMIIPLLLALLLGRVFCSWICPVSFFLELLDRLRKKIGNRKELHNSLLVAKKMIWFVLIADLIFSMILGIPLFVFLSPPGLIGREIMMLVFFKTFALEGMLLFLVVGLEFLTRRFFCRSFCPLGGLLALLGQKRKLRVVLESDSCTKCGCCDSRCPIGLSVSSGESFSAYCWNCGECVDVCQPKALAFNWCSERSVTDR